MTYQALDDEGMYQIGLVSTTGDDEYLLTSDPFDFEEPDWSADGVSIHCVKWLGINSEIGRVDALTGQYIPLNSPGACVIRDNPDT